MRKRLPEYRRCASDLVVTSDTAIGRDVAQDGLHQGPDEATTDMSAPTKPIAKLNLVTLFTRNADAGNARERIKGARGILGDHGFELRIWPGDAPTVDTVLDVDGEIDPERVGWSPTSPVAGRFPGLIATWLWIVFCRLGTRTDPTTGKVFGVAGVTVRDRAVPNLRPLVYINTSAGPLSTLAHEIGHAGGDLPEDQVSAGNLMWWDGSTRAGTALTPDQVAAIATRAHFRA